MTVVTYQGLHAACSNQDDEEDEMELEEESPEVDEIKRADSNLDLIVKALKAQDIQTIIVDEAHHLKNEWWKTLTKIKKSLNTTIVGLTATPPYDVTATEWQRYIELNGPVDTEISVPELIIEGNLCPHQDYVYFTFPTAKEEKGILDFRENINKLFEEIKRDQTIIKAIESHPIWQDPKEHLEWIYSNLSYYSACLIFLSSNGRNIPKTHLEVIGDRKLEIPELDYEWLASLLDFYLYKEKQYFETYEDHRKALENRLRRYGAIERRQINFSHNKSLTSVLTSSISKLDGIKTIVDFEYAQLGNALRLVVLTDFIRKEFLVDAAENNLELNKIGVIPIFEKLRRHNPDQKKIGVLTGSVIIIPKTAVKAFEAKAAHCGIAKINATPISYDKAYVSISQTFQIKHHMVHIITQIFQEGEIEVLVGTKSLLGEGWDAPAINSLILASFVGSFVLSNQMRGRAIRTQIGNKDKTSNVWHLACIDPTLNTGGEDIDLLRRRFRSFVGVSFDENAGIENGIDRLNMPDPIYKKKAITKKNEEMFAFAADRESLKQRWKMALKTGVSLVEEIKIPFPKEKEYRVLKSMYLTKTIGNLFVTLVAGMLGYSLKVLELFGKIGESMTVEQDIHIFLGIFGTIGLLIFGRLTLKTFWLYLKYRDISKDVHNIGNALLASLVKLGVIRTHMDLLKVHTTIDDWGAVFCFLEGGTTFEKSTFINALVEIVQPIDNPRYVIERKNLFLKLIRQIDYHAVPDLLGRNKQLAEDFRTHWQKFVGSCDLIFTRTIKGRKLLLRSRVQSLASHFEKRVTHVNRWR